MIGLLGITIEWEWIIFSDTKDSYSIKYENIITTFKYESKHYDEYIEHITLNYQGEWRFMTQSELDNLKIELL
jgi:hypothetical protein